jgi:hypothetical protein
MALRRGTERSGSTVPSILNRMETHEIPIFGVPTLFVMMFFMHILPALNESESHE